MKTIGLLGGMSWESTVSYYEAINEGAKQALGGLHSAKVVLYSVDFAEIEALQRAGDWAATAKILGDAGAALKSAGAEFLLICTNTMHRVAEEVEAAAGLPLLHIADATGEALAKDGVRRAGLLGTRFTMEQDFYVGRLRQNHGIDVLIPGAAQRRRVHEVIYRELCLGRLEPQSRADYLAIIESLAQRGAEAVVLGCTEIALLVDQSQSAVPLYDTTAIHAAQAVALALGD